MSKEFRDARDWYFYVLGILFGFCAGVIVTSIAAAITFGVFS